MADPNDKFAGLDKLLGVPKKRPAGYIDLDETIEEPPGGWSNKRAMADAAIEEDLNRRTGSSYIAPPPTEGEIASYGEYGPPAPQEPGVVKTDEFGVVPPYHLSDPRRVPNNPGLPSFQKIHEVTKGNPQVLEKLAAGELAGRPQPSGRAVGGGGSGARRASKEKSVGYGLFKRLDFLPDGLKPNNDAYLDPQFMDRVKKAYEEGEIDAKTFAKAGEVYNQYTNQSIWGTEVDAMRKARDLELFGIEGASDMMKLDSEKFARMANEQLELVDRLENSDVLFQAAQRRKERAMEEQLGIIRGKINKLEKMESSTGANAWGPAFGAMFSVIGATLSGAMSGGMRTPSGAADAISNMANIRIQNMANQQNALRSGLAGEFQVLNFLRTGMKDSEATHALARMHLMKNAQTKIQAIANQSMSEASKMRAEQLSNEIGLRIQADEAKIKATLTRKAEEEKNKFLSGARGKLSKTKKQLYNATQMRGADGYSDPIKGKSLFTFTEGGKTFRGFLDDDVRKDMDIAQRAYKQMRDGINDLKEIHAKGTGAWLDAGDRFREDQAMTQIKLADKELGKMGAWDAGVDELESGQVPSVLGPIDNAPIIGGQIDEKLKWLEQRADRLRANVLSRAKDRMIPGDERMFVNPETGEQEMKYIYYGDSAARDEHRERGAQTATQQIPEGGFELGPMQ